MRGASTRGSSPRPELARLLSALAVVAIIAAGCAATDIWRSRSTIPIDAVPSDKQSRFDYLASLRAVTPPPDQPSKSPGVGLVTLPPSSESPFSPYKQVPAGIGFIVQSDLGPPGRHDAVYTNDWYESTADGVTEVYAGGRTDDTTIGFVFVAKWDGDHANLLEAGEYETPKRAGAVTIIGATGDVLELAASDGARFRFDVSRLSYR